jgi:hypothetical protein
LSAEPRRSGGSRQRRRSARGGHPSSLTRSSRQRTVPSQITISGLMGGTGRFLHIPFDLSRPPITFIQQATDGLPTKLTAGEYVMFFGRTLGFVVNYTPDKALRCDLQGNALEVLPKAYRVGEVGLSIGSKPVDPRVLARALGSL